jgi:magnesium-protoporphyrin O-methyltransferase
MRSSCCSPFEDIAGRHFNATKVADELVRYRENGLGVTTRLLVDGITHAGVASRTVLDVGAGIGGLTLALLARGAASAVAVDASVAYLAAALDEATRQGRAGAIRFVHADFVEASDVGTAGIVALDRVVCCYPAFEPLINAALARAERCLALSYPRDVWYVRAAMGLENGRRRFAGNGFRTVVHPASAIQDLISGAGFRLSSRRETWMWSNDVYVRP